MVFGMSRQETLIHVVSLSRPQLFEERITLIQRIKFMTIKPLAPPRCQVYPLDKDICFLNNWGQVYKWVPAGAH